MDRAELDKLDREALIARAESAGVKRARILTRPELIDELLTRQASSTQEADKARGLFGVARNLLARIVERGLHLPDAADRIRSFGPPAAPRRVPMNALPTVTLAEIYAAQGHRDRAIETLRYVIEREPDHDAAHVLLGQLEQGLFGAAEPELPPEEPEEPDDQHDESGTHPALADDDRTLNGELIDAAAQSRAPMIDGGASREVHSPSSEPSIEPLPETKSPESDRCVAAFEPNGTVRVEWSVTRGTLEFLAAEGRSTLALFVVVIEPSLSGPKTDVRLVGVADPRGELTFSHVPEGALVRVAIGIDVNGMFSSIAHA